ncbi:restriction endonuclease [Alicyclobacillus sp. SP_1]|uniref:restriction endonuclease n=1 Tax=Alicyclobacillus sp. SP_1 TaxID=2942475 RepID=UPI0021578613|nr:restriction endonuclease [Alicyclobacillus sp. SP_1]
MNLTVPHSLYWELGAVIVLAIITKAIAPTKSKNKRKSSSSRKSNNRKGQANNRTSSTKRPDAEILRSSIDKLTWAEFERLLALYFRDHGYDVEEPGIGGNDGGVDLVITDKRTKERIAVQAKHWADRRHVGPNVIRELHSARLNTKPTCLYGMLVTSSDISPQARKEAQDRRIEYWHGAALQYRLEKWDKWQGKQSRRRDTGSK